MIIWKCHKIEFNCAQQALKHIPFSTPVKPMLHELTRLTVSLTDFNVLYFRGSCARNFSLRRNEFPLFSLSYNKAKCHKIEFNCAQQALKHIPFSTPVKPMLHELTRLTVSLTHFNVLYFRGSCARNFSLRRNEFPLFSLSYNKATQLITSTSNDNLACLPLVEYPTHRSGSV